MYRCADYYTDKLCKSIVSILNGQTYTYLRWPEREEKCYDKFAELKWHFKEDEEHGIHSRYTYEAAIAYIRRNVPDDKIPNWFDRAL